MKIQYKALVAIAMLLSISSFANTKKHSPKLIVQVVVDGLRYDNFVRYARNYSSSGLGKIATNGAQYRNARHDNITSYPFVGMASILTGAPASQHGITSQHRVNYTTNQIEDMFEDHSCVGVGTVSDRGNFSPKSLMVQTVGDLLRNYNDSSKVISIAQDYRNAIIAGGSNPYAVYWLDTTNNWWATNSYYTSLLPKWAERFNQSEFFEAICNKGWSSQRDLATYINNKSHRLQDKGRKGGVFEDTIDQKREGFEIIDGSPLVDDFLYEMARQTIINEKLGTDSAPDLLTLSFSGLARINELYGISSVEAEDAHYNLDRIITDLTNLLDIQCGKDNYVIVFTGSCGTSNDIDLSPRAKSGAFNIMQFKVMMNSFLAAQFGVYDLILNYEKGNVFLNRKLIFEKQLSLNEVREKCATFALQFLGVAHSYTADAVRYMSYSRGVQGRVIDSIYPKYAGDVVLILLPNWVEVSVEGSRTISTYGSGYDYDVHVPLIFYGNGIKSADIVAEVGITDIAPTICEIMQIGRTDISQGVALEEIVSVSIN